jgi:hypothetical protein
VTSLQTIVSHVLTNGQELIQGSRANPSLWILKWDVLFTYNTCCLTYMQCVVNGASSRWQSYIRGLVR